MDQIERSLINAPCDLCGKNNNQLLYFKRGVLTGYDFRVVRCRSCGLIFLNPRLTEQSVAELYSREYYNGKGFDPSVNYIMDFSKESDTDKIFRPEETVRIIKEIVPPPAMLLDFGCGLGDLVRQANKHGYIAEGFEISSFALEFARANGISVYDSPRKLPDERYDMITAIEVLEHCFSPMTTLSAIYRCLKPGGIFYYTTCGNDTYQIKLVKVDSNELVSPSD